MGREAKLTNEELEAFCAQILAAADMPMAELHLDCDIVDDTEEIDFNVDFPPLPPLPLVDNSATPDTTSMPLTGTRPISIRVPARVIQSFKSRAADTGTNYQTLMNRALVAAADGFV